MGFINMVVKDMKSILYDVKSLAVLLLMPMVLMTILGMSLSGVFGDEVESGIPSAHIGVVKAYDMAQEMYKVAGRIDLESLSKSTLDGVNAEKNFFKFLDSDALGEILTYEVMTLEQGNKALADGEITALIVLPKDFVFNGYMVLQGSRIVTDIAYYIQEDNAFMASIVLSIIESYTETYNHLYAQQRMMSKKLLAAGYGDALGNMEDMFGGMHLEDSGVTLDVRALEQAETINSFQYYAAAMMCMFLLYAAGVGGRALLQERRDKTVSRLVVSGNGLTMMIASNFVRVMGLVLVQSTIMVTYASLVLGIDWGSMTTVVITVLLSAFTIAAMGTFIGIITLIADNYKVANAFEFGLVYVMALLGGSYIPVEVLPEPMQRLGFLAVNGQALNMYINGMYRLPIRESLPEMAIMTAFGMGFMGLSWLLIRGEGRQVVC